MGSYCTCWQLKPVTGETKRYQTIKSKTLIIVGRAEE